MKALERVLAEIHFQETAERPIFLQIGGLAATLMGIPLHQYLTDPQTTALTQYHSAQIYKNDIMFGFLDFCVEAEAMGAPVTYSVSGYPSISGPLITDWKETLSLDLPNPRMDGRMPVLLETCERLLEKDQGEHFIVGQCLGPTTLATQIFGIENSIYLLVDNPEGFNQLLNFTTQISKSFAQAILATGVSAVLINDPSASPNVFPKSTFENMIYPYLEQLINDLKKRQEGLVWLQITGNTTSILSIINKLPVDLITLDSPVELIKAQEVITHKAIIGNINPLLFTNCDGENLHKQTQSALAKCRPTGFILGTGCDIPVDANPERLDDFLCIVGRI